MTCHSDVKVACVALTSFFVHPFHQVLYSGVVPLLPAVMASFDDQHNGRHEKEAADDERGDEHGEGCEACALVSNLLPVGPLGHVICR